MPKFFILALDGLEYDLVRKWKLKNLLQKRHGKIMLSASYYHINEHVPYTPVVWASFITGLPPEKHGIKSWWTYGKRLDYIRNLPYIRWIKSKRKFLMKIGLKPRVPNRNDLNSSTIFDIIKPSIALSVPSYNSPTSLHLKLAEALMKGLKTFEIEILNVYEQAKRKTFLRLLEDWQLFMTCFYIADLMGHIHIAKRPLRLRSVYQELNRLTHQIKQQLPPNVIFLIVSDHGMKPEGDGTGNHTNHAFWSLNIETQWKPKNITDFYPKIIEWSKDFCPIKKHIQCFFENKES
jgi:predicted AlkP superfamily pyrophosphatase or phosphodiesterase